MKINIHIIQDERHGEIEVFASAQKALDFYHVKIHEEYSRISQAFKKGDVHKEAFRIISKRYRELSEIKQRNAWEEYQNKLLTGPHEAGPHKYEDLRELFFGSYIYTWQIHEVNFEPEK